MDVIPITNESPAACPVCGSYAGQTLAVASPLLAVADVLVIRTLEVWGKRLVRVSGGRNRYNELGNRPWHLAHTLWQPPLMQVSKSLKDAWTVVPALFEAYGCCDVTAQDVIDCLNCYTEDLLITGTPHDVEELRYRFSAVLGIDVPSPGHRHATTQVAEG